MNAHDQDNLHRHDVQAIRLMHEWLDTQARIAELNQQAADALNRNYNFCNRFSEQIAKQRERATRLLATLQAWHEGKDPIMFTMTYRAEPNAREEAFRRQIEMEGFAFQRVTLQDVFAKPVALRAPAVRGKQ